MPVRPDLAFDVSAPPGPPLTHLRPHRGALVLTMGAVAACCLALIPLLSGVRGVATYGLLFFFTCPAAGLSALVLGSLDRAAIRDRRMDPAGYGSTLAGLLLGMISVILFTIALLFQAVAIARNRSAEQQEKRQALELRHIPER